MDKTVLGEYMSMRVERDDLEKSIARLRRKAERLRDAQVADTVTGSREDLTIGPIKIVGRPTREYHDTIRRIQNAERRYRQLENELLDKLQEVEDFLQTVKSSKVRTILRRRYIEGMPWERISRSFGKSRDWARNTVDNYFRKNHL